jgi:hypothetical protein
MTDTIRKPKIARDLPSPKKVEADALHRAVEEARAWRDAVDRVTERMEPRGDDEAPVRLK